MTIGQKSGAFWLNALLETKAGKIEGGSGGGPGTPGEQANCWLNLPPLAACRLPSCTACNHCMTVSNRQRLCSKALHSTCLAAPAHETLQVCCLPVCGLKSSANCTQLGLQAHRRIWTPATSSVNRRICSSCGWCVASSRQYMTRIRVFQAAFI